jgi:DNA-binding response OmpR family regulator
MSGRSGRILFVDNRPDFLHQPVLRLRLEGYEVDEARSAEEGKRAAREEDYDVLIFDADLPGADGWEVLKDIRGSDDLGGTKVIVLMAGKGETGKLSMVPVDAEIRRPFTMAQLLDAVRNVLAGGEA